MTGVCTGPGPCDTSPNGPGPNWVTEPEVNGLPLYIRAIMHALRRKGMSEAQAAATAVATVKHWAAGGGHVSDETRQRAAAAAAEWERKKAASHSRSSSGTRDMGAFVATESSSAGDLLPVGPSERQAQAVVETERRKRDRQATPHAHRGKDLEHCSVCGRSVTDPVHGLSEEAKRVYRPAQPPYLAGKRHRGPDGHRPMSTGHVGGSVLRRIQAAKQDFDRDCDEVEPQIAAAVLELFRRQQTAVLSRLEGKRGRQALRKALPTKCPCGQAIKWDPLDGPQHFDGSVSHDDGRSVSGKIVDSLGYEVLARLLREGNRAAQPANPQGNPPPPAQPAPAVAATLSGVPPAVAATAAGIVAPLAAFPPMIAAQAVAMASAIFDVAFWTTATAVVLWAAYQRARELAISRVDAQIGHVSSLAEAAKASETTTDVDTSAAKAEDLVEEKASAAAAQAAAAGEMPPEPPSGPLMGDTAGPGQPPSPGDVLRQRANRMAATITETTFRAIAESLAEGLEAGDDIGRLAAAVRAVFATSQSRAERIARTETIGALNQAANAQAEWLGSDHVARKQWAAHHDERTRPTHRMADGQVVPLGSKFLVGQSLMECPGDPTAPASETCNCRCVLLFYPPGAEVIPR